MIDPGTRTWLAGIRQEIEGLRGLTQTANAATIAESFAMQRAIQHSLLIIAESARQIPASVRAKRPDLPWDSIRALDSLLARSDGEGTTLPWPTIVDHLDDLDAAARSWMEEPA